MFKIKLKELEDDILERLSSSEGNVTDDKELIEALEETKRIANDIEKKMEESAKVQAEINLKSEKYRPVADRGSLLYFLMCELQMVHTYYVYVGSL